MNIKHNSTILGVDVQTRGIAIGVINITTAKLIDAIWFPIQKQSHEGYIYQAYYIMNSLTDEIKPLICTVEQPTAIRSSSTPVLWGMYGAAIAGSYKNSKVCEAIVVPSWKKYSGLNQWYRDASGKGTIPKELIPQAITEILDIKEEYKPQDVYDAIAIAYASYNRNKERISRL